MLDIDHFKQVNDTYGHLAGDSVLRECVNRIRSVLRQYDSLGRFGGEEFLVVVPGVEKDPAAAVSARIRSAIDGEDFSVDGTLIHVTVSQGVVTWDGAATVEGLVAGADRAMYRAKENGRNRVELGELGVGG
jgi:diguanylate cyclase (GGDEF)-like protein